MKYRLRKFISVPINFIRNTWKFRKVLADYYWHSPEYGLAMIVKEFLYDVGYHFDENPNSCCDTSTHERLKVASEVLHTIKMIEDLEDCFSLDKSDELIDYVVKHYENWWD